MNNSEWVYEGMAARLERANRRLFILSILLVMALIFSNIAWLYYESKFDVAETTTIEAEQDGEGINIVGMGDINYGSEGYDNKN